MHQTSALVCSVTRSEIDAFDAFETQAFSMCLTVPINVGSEMLELKLI